MEFQIKGLNIIKENAKLETPSTESQTGEIVGNRAIS